jgi:hypothetical protein
VKPHLIISSVDSIPQLFSKHMDCWLYWLKKVVGTLLPAYIKDTEHLT